MEEPLDTWFKREILSHEAMLVRFLLRIWPRRDEVPDIRQEARFLGAAGVSGEASAMLRADAARERLV